MGNATYYWGGNNLKKGSQGYDVSQLQTFLKDQGYFKGNVDGIFGDVTDGALRAYQTAMGIGVDGEFGPTTAGKAGFKNYNTSVGAAEYTPLKFNSYSGTVVGKDANGNDITDIQARDDAYKALTGYQDPSWSNAEAYKTKREEYMSREPFSYDFNADALYQQYKDRYIQQGQMAMQDAMGQAAALTGGYGNSYAASVGNQAYQQSLQQLNDVIPELYKLAYDRYDQKGQDMLNALGLLEKDRDMYMEDWQRGYDKLADAYSLADSRHQTNASMYYANLANENAAITAQNEQAWKEVQWEDQQNDEAYNRAQEMVNDGGYKVVADSSGNPTIVDKSGNIVKTGQGITSSMIEKAKTFKSNDDLADWAYGLAASGAITEDEADQLIAENMDLNEKYIETTDEQGKVTKTASYSQMIENFDGWEMETDGGWNLLGIDKDASVRTPDNKTMTLKELKQKLVDEGMDASVAQKKIKALQQKLGISSNWLFGW